MPEKVTAPFPYFGGKSSVAQFVWNAFGTDVKHYIEPFFRDRTSACLGAGTQAEMFEDLTLESG